MAQTLYDAAMKLVAEGKHAEACPKLEESYRLDAAMGTQYRLAECYEKIGKLASAWSTYIAVADAARQAGNTVREQTARSRAEAILSRVPKLTIVVPQQVAALAGVEVKRNGRAVLQPAWNQPLPVDPGGQTITVTAPGKKPLEARMTVEEGRTASVSIPELEDADGEASVPQQGGDNGSTRRIGAIVAGVIGVAGVTVGSIYGLKTFSQWDEATSYCENGDHNKCTMPQAREAEDAARRSGTISTVSFVIGGVGLAAAAALWFTAPSPSASPARSGFQLVPAAGPQGGGLTLRARF